MAADVNGTASPTADVAVRNVVVMAEIAAMAALGSPVAAALLGMAALPEIAALGSPEARVRHVQWSLRLDLRVVEGECFVV